MRGWASVANQKTAYLPRAEDAPVAHSGGFDSDRILIVGAGPALGWGVLTHDLALSGAVARALTARTGRGTDIRVIADPDMRAADTVAALAESDLARYDAVVVVLGINDAVRLTPARKWRRELSKVIETITAEGPRGVKIVITGVQPISSIPVFDKVPARVADSHAVSLNVESQKLCSSTADAVFVPLTAPPMPPASAPERYRGPVEYAHWAQEIAGPLANLLESDSRLESDRRTRGRITSATAEAARHVAIRGMLLPGKNSGEALNRIVSIARRVFDADAALITVVNEGQHVQLAVNGLTQEEVALTHPFCDYSMTSREVTIVRDARDDEEFRTSALVAEGRRMRFYAGFPIEAPSGERIGSLNVFDSRPRRRADDIDMDLLNSLTPRIQKELWRYLPARIAVPDAESPMRGVTATEEIDVAETGTEVTKHDEPR